MLHISGLPSISDLSAWRQQGITHLLNVSGVDIFEIYQDHQDTLLADFTISQFYFADIFSSGNALANHSLADTISPTLYLQTSSENQREPLLAAVQLLTIQLANTITTSVFCHRGLGRSPLVVAGAFQQYFQESSQQAIHRTRALHKPALFTDISLSALAWCNTQNEHSNRAF